MNTKQDYINCKNTVAGKLALQSLISNRYYWENTLVLDTKEEGLEDETHRIIEDDNYYIQQEYKEDPNALIFRLGFTVEEVEKLLEN